MITPIRAMTIDQICERKEDLLIGSDDIKKLAKNERNKAIDELCKEISKLLSGDTKHLEGKAYYKELAYLEVLKIAEQMKGE